MGKTRDLFKKIRDTKGIFHAKMGSIKDRNGMELTEAEDIKKRWQEYREELYKKDLHNPKDLHDYRFNAIPIPNNLWTQINTNDYYFHRNKIPKFARKHKRLQIAKTLLRKTQRSHAP